MVFGDLFVLGTRTLCKGGVVIHWLGHLGRCVGTRYHASFCCGCAVLFWLRSGTFDCVQLQFTLYYHDVAVVMIVICLWCLLYVSHGCIDPVGSHAPHQNGGRKANPGLSSQRALRRPPPYCGWHRVSRGILTLQPGVTPST